WTSYGLQGQLTLDLMKRNDDLETISSPDLSTVQWERISSDAIDDGEWHSWAVSRNDLGFNAAAIRVRSNMESGVVADSAPFVIGGGVDVQYPTAESILPIGSRPIIRWRSEGYLGRLRIELWRGKGKQILTIADDAIDDGEWHSWTVPTTLEDGYGYQVRIYSKEHQTLVGFSDLFQIGAVLEWIVPSLEQDDFGGALRSPNSRPSYFATGSRPVLRWQTKGELSGNVRIDLMLGPFRFATIASDALNDGEWHSWTVPAGLRPGSGYQLWLRSLTRPKLQVFSHPFHIGQMIDLWVDRNRYARPSVGSTGPTPDIRWRTEGLASDTRLTLQLVPKGGTPQVISTNVINDGEWHSFQVASSMKKGDYRFRLNSNENPGVFAYSSYFRVT
ncbi:MAG: Ser-Thr-rich GPI-anchored membrane family protein, partial [Desulfosarcinaceae bacterium]|nr:Ser-Thr-rich GPI-anchored membrane family protein [Desulfosarcinaceae bacterium]